MSKFQIATPGGYEVEVEAANEQEAISKAEKSWQTMPRIIAKGEGNVRVFERPSGEKYLIAPGYSTTDPDRINQVLQGQSAGQVSRTAIDQETIAQAPIAARAGEFARGTPFIGSYLDEAVGMVAGPEATAGMRAMSGAMQRQNPGETLGLNLAGGLSGAAGMLAATPAAIGGRVGQMIAGSPGGRLLPQVARGAAVGSVTGATEGAVFGAGEGTDMQSRGQEATRGAGFGATFGGLLGAAGPVAQRALGNVANRVTGSDVDGIAREFGISTDAAKVIKSTFDQGGDIQAAAAAIARAGDEGMLADAGPAAQALLDAAAQSGGQAGQVARQAVDQRMARTSSALDMTLDDMLGQPPLGPRTAVDDIARRTATQRTEAYNRAFSQPIDYSTGGKGEAVLGVLDRVPDRVLADAIAEANEDMLANGQRNLQIMASIGDNGKVTFSEMPNVQQLNELKKAMQTLAYQNTDDFGRLNARGQRYNRLAGQLRDAVGEAAPGYREAVSLGGDKLAEERAFMLGRDLLSPSTEIEDVLGELGDKPSQAQLDAARLGLRSRIAKAVGDVRAIASDPGADALEARQVIKAVTDMSSDNARAKIKSILGNDADALLSELDKATQSAVVRAAMAQNSKTAARTAGREMIDEITAPGILGQAMQGEPVNTTKAAIQALTGQTSEYTAAQKQRIYEDIARALTQKRGASAQAALRYIDQAMQGQQLTEAQNNFVTQQLTTALFGGGVSGTTRGASAEERQR